MKIATTTYSGDFIEASAQNPDYQAYQLLHWGFVALPVIAGLDKFFSFLTNWTIYLWPPLARILGGAGTFMRVVGVIEILAGCLVAFKPKLGAAIVAVWILGIVVNLLLIGKYFDIALRDFGLFLAAMALYRLSVHFDQKEPAKTLKG
jgi:hypothetical protein